jgi:hypothetical protein
MRTSQVTTIQSILVSKWRLQKLITQEFYSFQTIDLKLVPLLNQEALNSCKTEESQLMTVEEWESGLTKKTNMEEELESLPPTTSSLTIKLAMVCRQNISKSNKTNHCNISSILILLVQFLPILQISLSKFSILESEVPATPESSFTPPHLERTKFRLDLIMFTTIPTALANKLLTLKKLLQPSGMMPTLQIQHQ